MHKINRDMIVTKLTTDLKKLDYVYAMWLEGADGNGQVDRYSDIDVWVDFEDAFEDEVYSAVENSLAELSPIDYKYVMRHGHPKIRQRIYHIEDTSRFLMIDFCWQLHSRPSAQSCFDPDDRIEAVSVLFDKNDVISFKTREPESYQKDNEQLLVECRYRFSQSVRVEKYILRKQYLESYAYYNRYVLEPLISLLRLKYTPDHTDYYLVHISHHIPAESRKKLEYFARIASMDDIKARLPEAKLWFDDLIKQLEK